MKELYEYMGTHLPEDEIAWRRAETVAHRARVGPPQDLRSLPETLWDWATALGLSSAQIRGNPNSPSSEGTINKI